MRLRSIRSPTTPEPTKASSPETGKKKKRRVVRHSNIREARKKLRQHLSPGKIHPIDIVRPKHVWRDPVYGVIIFIAEVSPEQAREILDRCNPINRKISPDTSTMLVNEIASGNWRVVNQGVGVDILGYLIDGQHRLVAIWESGKSAVLMFVCNLASEAQEVIDRVRTRTVRDDMSILGIQYGRERNSFVKMSAELIAGADVTLRTMGSYEKWLSHLEDGVEWGIRELVKDRRTKLAPVGGTLVFAHKKNPEKVEEFGFKLMEGCDLPKGSPILGFSKYLDRLIRSKAGYGGSNRVEISMHLLRCLRDYIERYDPPSRRSPAADGEVLAYFRTAYSEKQVNNLSNLWRLRHKRKSKKGKKGKNQPKGEQLGFNVSTG